MATRNTKKSTYNVVDIFSGVGGLSYGFNSLPQFNVIMANEIDKDIAAAYRANHPSVHMVNCDIGTLTDDLIKSVVGDKKIDVLVGGPPCQSYSTIGKRQMDDRANLFLEYKRILSLLRPSLFVFENVSGMLSMDKGRLYPKIEKEFQDLGYSLKKQVLNAADYGVPQLRERVILVGMLGKNVFDYPLPTHGEGKLPYVTLAEAIGDLPSIASGESADQYSYPPNNDFLRFVRSQDPKQLTEHNAPNNGAHLVELMRALKDGQGRNDLPDHISPGKGFGNTYAKLWWNKPSTTITRNFACPSSSRCIHPRDSRAMTVREGARLQSFPDNYVFVGSEGKKRLEIGNAVPPLLSNAIAKQVLLALENVYKEERQ